MKLSKIKNFKLDSGIVAACADKEYSRILHEADELMDTKEEFIKKLDDPDFYDKLQSAILSGGSLMSELLSNM